jgi:hypothetical protein
VTWDVTEIVKDWVEGGQPNYGLLLRHYDFNVNSQSAIFAPRESSGQEPKLEINYSPPRPQINSQWTNSPPSIDGIIESGEWSNLQITFQSPEYPDSYVLPTYVYFMNDNTNLYVMVDAVGDTTDGASDECLLTFNYQDSPPYFQHYAELIGTSTSWGEGGNIASYDGAVGFNSHKFYEFAIPLSAINAQPDQPIDFCSPAYGIKGASISYDSETSKDNVWPQGLDVYYLNSWGILNFDQLSRSSAKMHSVGGIVTSVNKLMVLTPYLAVIGLIAATTATVLVVSRRRKD